MSLCLLAALLAAPPVGSLPVDRPADPPAVWPRHTIDDSSRGADGVRLADVDGDGRLDVVTGWEEGGEVRVAFGPPLDQVREPWPTVLVGRVRSPEDAVAVDLDGDGRLEVLSSAEGKAQRLSVHSYSGDPREPASWTTAPLGDSVGRQRYMFAVPWPEEHGGGVIAAGKGQEAALEWWRPGADPADWSAWTATPLRPVGWTMSLRVEDMDGDGDPDLLLSDRKGDRRGLFWLEFDPMTEAWTERLVGGTDVEAMFLTVCDLDGDGDRDVACLDRGTSNTETGSRGGTLLLFERLDESGDRWRRRSLPLPDDAGSGKAVVATRTAAGAVELLCPCGLAKNRCSVVRYRFGPGEDVWTADPVVDCPGGTVGTKFDRAELLDLDGDGDLDLITCEERENLGVIWYERPGA